MKHVHLYIKKFKMSKIKPTDKILIIGLKMTGKSVLIKDILQNVNHTFNECIIISYSNYFEDVTTNTFAPHLIDDAYGSLKLIGDNNICVIDNVLTCQDHHVQQVLDNNNMYIVSVYDECIIPDEMKHVFDYVFILRTTSRLRREKIYKKYGNVFPSFKCFNDILMQMSEKERYTCMVIDNKASNSDIQDNIYWYSADN